MTKTFTADNGREFTVSDEGMISGNIEVDVNELIRYDLEGALDLFAEKLVGNTLLSDISYSVVGAADGQIVMKIDGDVQHILALRAENDDAAGISP